MDVGFLGKLLYTYYRLHVCRCRPNTTTFT